MALTEDSETAASVSKEGDRAVQDREHLCSKTTPFHFFYPTLVTTGNG